MWFMSRGMGLAESVLVQHFVEVKNRVSDQLHISSYALVKLAENLNFFGLRRSEGGEFNAVRELNIEGGADFLHPIRESAGSFEKNRAIQQIKRLERRVGTGSADDTELAIRCVEGDHARIGGASSNEGVEPAPLTVAALRGFPVPAYIRDKPGAGRLVRHHRRTAEFPVKQAAEGEGLIADLLASQTKARTAGKEAIYWITFKRLSGRFGRLPVCPAEHNLPEQSFLAPLHASLKAHGEIIQKVLVDWEIPLGAKIFERLDEADPEELFPYAIHVHPGRERVFSIGQPL